MKAKDFDGSGNYWIWCPGCRSHHIFATVTPFKNYIKTTDGQPKTSLWTFNGDVERPTFQPSMLVNEDHPHTRCHSYVTDGNIRFLPDCGHEFKGKTLPLEDVVSKDK